MLTEIRIKNFKCFKDEIIIPAGRINLLTGLNGRGKSTSLQPLLCMKQSFERLTRDRLFFNWNCVELGNFGDVKNVSTRRDEDIIFTFEFETEDGYFIAKYYFREDEQDDLSSLLKKIEAEGELKGKPFELSVLNRNNMAIIENYDIEASFYNLFIDYRQLDNPELSFVGENIFNISRIHYVSADRIGPRDFYPRESFPEFPNVGSKGQFAVDVLAKTGDKQVKSPLCLRASEPTVMYQVSAWMNYIFSGGRVDITHFEANIISMRMNADSSINRFKPVNVGFGYSYLLPIVVSGLVAEPGDILIVENPEAHLVPSAQSRIANFLAKVSQAGVQVFIESHSEHILNGLRIAVKEKICRHEETNIIFFEGDKAYSIKKIPVTEEGKIKNWPDNFFDQAEKDFERIHGI
jgi:predicted ATPase